MRLIQEGRDGGEHSVGERRMVMLLPIQLDRGRIEFRKEWKHEVGSGRGEMTEVYLVQSTYHKAFHVAAPC